MPPSKEEKIAQMNELLKVIGDGGRRFFFNKGVYAHFILENGRLYFFDDYTKKKIWIYRESWKGFSHGGTLKTVVQRMRDYIIKDEKIASCTFGPWPEWYCGGDLWGYEDYMNVVRQKANELGVVK